MRVMRCQYGFTLTELVVALIVTGIILSAVVVLADAMATGNEIAGDTSEKQAWVRYATLRITELLRHCKFICGIPGTEIAVWRADDNGDGQININELAYIDWESGGIYIRLCEFSSSSNAVVPLSEVGSLPSGWWSGYGASAKYTVLVPECSSVQGMYMNTPPFTDFLGIAFVVEENGISREYEICTHLDGLATNMVDSSGNIVSDDD